MPKAVTLSVISVAAALAVVAAVYVLVGIKGDHGVEAAGGMAAPALPTTSQGVQGESRHDATTAMSVTVPVEPAVSRIRQEFLTSTDLRVLHDRLMLSKEPGAQLYAAAAIGECAKLNGHFGIGSDAWTRFHKLVPEAAPDRAQRVDLFRSMQARCRGFAQSGTRLALDALAVLFRKQSAGDPYVDSLAMMTKFGLRDRAVDHASLVASIDLALSTQDPELLSGLAGAWSRSEPPTGVLRVDEEALAYALGWTLAIQRVTGSTPSSFMQLQHEVCIAGKGCGPATVTEVYRRYLSDRPVERVGAIIAMGEAKAPAFESMIRDKQIGPFLSWRG